MSTVEAGQSAPEINLPTNGNGTFNLTDHTEGYVVVYFYPKDDTPGCTKESCGFNEALKDFEKRGATIVGISKCSVAKHDKFQTKYDLQFPLASDEDGDVCERYGVWKEKSMYGKTYMGIERSTFLIGPDGVILQAWRKVKVPGHVDEVKAALEAVQKQAA